MPEKKNLIKLSFVIDPNEGTIEGKILPKIKKGQLDGTKNYLNAILASTRLGLAVALDDLPFLRPATEAEVNAKLYVFQDVERDNALFRTRKAVYDAVAKSFDDALKELFPDVQYIQASIQHQQHIVTEMSEEEAKEHQLMVEKLVETIRNEKANEVN